MKEDTIFVKKLGRKIITFPALIRQRLLKVEKRCENTNPCPSRAKSTGMRHSAGSANFLIFGMVQNLHNASYRD